MWWSQGTAQTKKHSKEKDPKSLSGKKDPKYQEGLCQGTATSCCLQQLGRWQEECGSLLCKQPGKSSWNGECKAKTSGDAVEWQYKKNQGCVYLFFFSCSPILFPALCCPLVYLKASLDQKIQSRSPACDVRRGKVTSSLSNEANAERESSFAAETALPLSEPASTRAKPSPQVGKTF